MGCMSIILKASPSSSMLAHVLLPCFTFAAVRGLGCAQNQHFRTYCLEADWGAQTRGGNYTHFGKHVRDALPEWPSLLHSVQCSHTLWKPSSTACWLGEEDSLHWRNCRIKPTSYLDMLTWAWLLAVNPMAQFPKDVQVSIWRALHG